MSNIVIVGPGRCGKDEAGMFLHNHLRIPYGGSCSWQALPQVAVALNTHPQIAWETRHECRDFWKDFCDTLRASDPLYLVKKSLAIGQVVTGVRGLPEIQAAASSPLVKHILWIERPGTPPDFTMDFGKEYATEVITNDGTLREFHLKLVAWACNWNLALNLSAYGLDLVTAVRSHRVLEKLDVPPFDLAELAVA